MDLKEYAKIIRLVLGHLAGQLTTEEYRQLDDWLDRSDRNRAYFGKWCDEAQQDRLLEKMAAYDVAEGWQAVVRRKNARKRLRWMAVAAASVMVLVGSWGMWSAMRQSSPVPPGIVQEISIQPGKRMARLLTASGETVSLDTLRQVELNNLKVYCQQGTFVLQTSDRGDKKAAPEYHCVDVPEGGEFSFKLPDGTKVFLNAGSRLRFPEYFTPGRERRIFLSGEAYFDVVHDTASPFLVCLEHTTVKVLGTSFNVTAYPEEGSEVTTLVHGAVTVEQTADGKELALAPGQQSCYDVTRKTLSRQKVDVSYYTSWKDGVFAFHKQPLGQVMKTLARWYLFEIHYADPALSKILYTGKIARHASILEVLHTFELMDELHFDVRGKAITVSRK